MQASGGESQRKRLEVVWTDTAVADFIKSGCRKRSGEIALSVSDAVTDMFAGAEKIPAGYFSLRDFGSRLILFLNVNEGESAVRIIGVHDVYAAFPRTGELTIQKDKDGKLSVYLWEDRR